MPELSQKPPQDPRRAQYLEQPVVPVEPERVQRFADLLETYAGGSFGRRDLGTAFRIWCRMLESRTLIFMGLSGAMIPAGMSAELQFLMRHRLIDCLVSTGANLSHDIGESLGWKHYQGSVHVDDEELGDLWINRVHDTFFPEEGFVALDDFVYAALAKLPSRPRPYSARELLYYLGQQLAQVAKRPGLLTTAAACGVPIFCQAIADSELGVAISSGRDLRKHRIHVDPTLDNSEMRDIVRASQRAGWATGEVLIGGGVPRNSIQQAVVSTLHIGEQHPGHKYGVLITTDTPFAGGASGSTFAETKSWRKLGREADAVIVHADATIVFPLLELGLADRLRGGLRRPAVPQFDLAGETIGVHFPDA